MMNAIDRCSGLRVRLRYLMLFGMRKFIVVVKRRDPLHPNEVRVTRA